LIAAVVLAAGTSSRLGSPKQLLSFRGRPVLVAVVENLLTSRLDRVVVVLGHQSGEVARVLEGLPVEVVVNQRYIEGQASSLKCGLAALDPEVRAALFALGDQPLVRPSTVRLLVDGYRSAGGIAAPFYQGQRGNPVIFDRRFFPDLELLKGDAGAREIIRSNPESLLRVDVDDPGVVLDIDTWEDYQNIICIKL